MNDVLFSELQGNGGNVGIITLNRPQVLNSLNQDMILAMHAQLKIWDTSENIKAVVIRAAEGRAFCAGGDIRSIYDKCKNHDATAVDFFRDEYQLNRFIFHFQKPYIALLDGITMGGGVGISIHGSHRVATERLTFAMPETGIGFFPDVGGTYFLPRLTGYMGFYLGLVGTRISCDDCVAFGIAQHKVARESLNELVNTIARQEFGNDAKQSVTNIIKQFTVTTNYSTLQAKEHEIDHYFSAPTAENILEELHASSNDFAKEIIETLAKKSPTSLRVSLHAMQQGKQLKFDDCMRQEYRLTYHFLQGHDFLEGIRSVIIDKDQKPMWKPSSLADVSPHDVEKYFSPVTQELA